MKVFLGGTCNNSQWRRPVIAALRSRGIEYFNPLVESWNAEARAREIKERGACDICLCTITPKMTGAFAIAEIVEAAITRPEKTIFNVLSVDGEEAFSETQLTSLVQVGELVRRHGARFCVGIDQVMQAVDDIAARKKETLTSASLDDILRSFFGSDYYQSLPVEDKALLQDGCYSFFNYKNTLNEGIGRQATL